MDELTRERYPHGIPVAEISVRPPWNLEPNKAKRRKELDVALKGGRGRRAA